MRQRALPEHFMPGVSRAGCCFPLPLPLPLPLPCHAMPCHALRLGEVGLIGDVAAFASRVSWAGRRHPAALGLDSAGQFVVADPGHVVV